jgi:purine nucleosidase
VIAAVLWPELFSTRLCRVDIELAEGPTVGRTTIDWWGRSGAEPNAAVVEAIDADAMFQRMAACIHTLD